MENTKLALIAGGTGSVGEGIVKTFLEKGYTVVVPARSRQTLDQLASYCGHNDRLKLYEANISKPDGAGIFFDLCKAQYTSFDIIVATIGGWRQGKSILDLSWDEWTATLEDNLSSHFLCMKLGYPLLTSTGTFVHINGMGAESIIPTAAAVVAAAAAQMRLALTLAAEQQGDGRKIYELVLGVVNTRRRNLAPQRGHAFIDPESIARYILFLQEGSHALSKKVLHQLPDLASVKEFIER